LFTWILSLPIASLFTTPFVIFFFCHLIFLFLLLQLVAQYQHTNLVEPFY
jgi:hypothetical protein